MADFRISSISCADSSLLAGRSHKFIIKGNGFRPGITAAQISGRNVTPAVTSSKFIDSGTLEIEVYIDERDANQEHQINIINADGNQAIAKLRLGDLRVVKIGPQFNGNEPMLELPADIIRGDVPLDTVIGLLRRGTDVNAKEGDGSTLLLCAAINKRKDIAELLIAEGADVNIKNDDGWTPLHFIAISGEDMMDLAELLIAKGADLNARDNYGATPLHWASREGNKDMAELLITKGANINAEDSLGSTPLRLARWDHKIDVVGLLRKHGARE